MRLNRLEHEAKIRTRVDRPDTAADLAVRPHPPPEQPDLRGNRTTQCLAWLSAASRSRHRGRPVAARSDRSHGAAGTPHGDGAPL